DGERRAVTADGSDDDRSVAALGGLRSESAQQRERLEVDAGQPDPGLLAGGHVALDEVAVGDDEQNSVLLLALVVDALAEQLVVEHGVLERDRERLLGAEVNGVLELLRVVDPAELEHADTDAVARDPEPHALTRKLVFAEERLQRGRERVGLAELTADDDALVERGAGHLDDLGGAVVDDARCGELRCADLETDDLLVPDRTLLLDRLRLFLARL